MRTAAICSPESPSCTVSSSTNSVLLSSGQSRFHSGCHTGTIFPRCASQTRVAGRAPGIASGTASMSATAPGGRNPPERAGALSGPNGRPSER